MRRNAKIIQIAGFRGILTAVFVVTCLGAGFVAFPGLVAMTIWNKYVTVLPQINLLQGILLWAMVALICYIANNQRLAISFESPKELTEENRDKLTEVISKNVKKIIPMAASLNSPEIVQALFDFGFVKKCQE